MAKQKKPNVTVFVDCPCCQSELKIEVYKKRVGTPEPAEYDVTTTVRVERAAGPSAVTERSSHGRC